MEKMAEVLIREEDKKVRIHISDHKPDISRNIVLKWQNVIDTLADMLNVPSSLIMQIKQNEIEVFLKGRQLQNPYQQGAGDTLGHGLYCETVLATNSPLLVPDALKLDKWKDNPDVKLNMISYLGFPLQWPDGQFFGTICVLDNKENHYSDKETNLLKLFKEVIELDLKRELEYFELEQEHKENEIKIREIHHRIKNNFSMIISFIQLKLNERTVNLDDLIIEVGNRIRAVSMLHDRLYKSKGFNCNTTAYLQELTNIVLISLSSEKVEVEYAIDAIDGLTDLFDFGMVIIELITNSIKYAFTGVKNPAISISLKKSADNLSFIYKDNGIGIKENAKTGLGSILIESFIHHFHGSLHKYNDNGAVFDFTLKLPGQ